MGNESIKDKAIAAYKNRGSMTRKDIAREFGVSENSLQSWLYPRKSRAKKRSSVVEKSSSEKGLKERILDAYDHRGSKTVTQVAEENGIKYWTLAGWIKQRNRKSPSKKAASPKPKEMKVDERQLSLPFEIDSAASERLRELRLENDELRSAIDETYDLMVDATRRLLSVVLNTPKGS